MKVKVFRQDGTDSGKSVTLDKTVFETDPNDHAIWLDVRRIQASSHQGTHKTKERGEVSFSTKKLYRQKGTGMARTGSRRSPLRRSGGRIFGPRPHDYRVKVNRKTQHLARRSALTYKAQDKAIRVVEDFTYDAPDTNEMFAFITNHELQGRSVLLVTGTHSTEIYKSGRNVPKLTIRNACDISTLDVMTAHVVVMQKGALKTVSEQLGDSVNKKTRKSKNVKAYK